MNSVCPWLYVWNVSQCVNAFPSCLNTSCNSPASCQCMRECDEQLYLGFERTYKCSLPNGTWINYDYHLMQGGKYQYGEHISDALQTENDHATSCPNNCSGRGTCDNGTCSCFQGYTHIDCSVGPEKYTKGSIFVYDLPRGANVWRQRIAEDRNSLRVSSMPISHVQAHRRSAASALYPALPSLPYSTLYSTPSDRWG
jgi:hypothetical protein